MSILLHDAADVWCSTSSSLPISTDEAFATTKRATDEERELVVSALLALSNSVDAPGSIKDCCNTPLTCVSDNATPGPGERLTPRANDVTSANDMDKDDVHSGATYTVNFNFTVLPNFASSAYPFHSGSSAISVPPVVHIPTASPVASTNQTVVSLLEQLLPEACHEQVNTSQCSPSSQSSSSLSNISGVSELPSTPELSVSTGDSGEEEGEDDDDGSARVEAPKTSSVSPAREISEKKQAKRKRSDSDNDSPSQPSKRRKSEVGHLACRYCHRQFTRLSTLKTHLRTHTGEKPFVCDVCGHGFAQKINLITHARTHDEQKPYHCDVCGKGFTQNSSLKTHLRIHTGEKPFHCTHCQTRYSDPSTLRKHLRTHTGERPYRCVHPGCKKVFSQSGNLRRHARMHARNQRSHE